MKPAPLILTLLLLLIRTTVLSQAPPNPSIADQELRRYSALIAAAEPHRPESVASTWLDATWYSLNLRITTAPVLLRGSVTMKSICRQNHPGFGVLDCSGSLVIDSVLVGGKRAAVSRQPASFTFQIDSLYSEGDLITITTYYHGVPDPTGYGSFVFSSHNTGTPWIWSLSEPYGAHDWWPCRDHPSDKADSADITVTVDSAYRVGSNGRLASVTYHPDHSVTYHWRERHPIATYLISVAVSDYAAFSEWFRYTPTDSMEVLNYVLPEHLSAAKSGIPVVVDGLRIFSDLFGLYPFIDEKYGHSEFGTGAMEHQTMTSTVTFDEYTLIHELAHQWFGDMITCRTWPNLWLNEGFATYSEALYAEQRYGTAAYRSRIDLDMTSARTAAGHVRVTDTSSIHNLFSGPLVYNKGAVILHMLRHVMGDALFFQSLRNYAGSPALRFGTAVTEDFRGVCEQTAGYDLGWFFDEWIDGAGYPQYRYSWSVRDSAGRRYADLLISQSGSSAETPVFRMPVDLRLSNLHGWDTTLTVWCADLNQQFRIPVAGTVDTVMLDPGRWILGSFAEVTQLPLPSAYAVGQNYPNPFNSGTMIPIDVPHTVRVRLTITNLLGQTVAVLEDGTLTPGRYLFHWTAGGIPGGIYFANLVTPSWHQARPLLLIR